MPLPFLSSRGWAGRELQGVPWSHPRGQLSAASHQGRPHSPRSSSSSRDQDGGPGASALASGLAGGWTEGLLGGWVAAPQAGLCSLMLTGLTLSDDGQPLWPH